MQEPEDPAGAERFVRQDHKEKLMFRKLRDALERALESATPPADLGAIASQMREAVIEQKAAVRLLQETLAKDEALLIVVREELTIAERRRGQAEAIGDTETVGIADKYVGRQRDRVAILERKVTVQREELAMAEGDLQDMTTQLAEAAKRRPAGEGERSANDAWNSLGEAGMDRPGLGVDDGEVLRGQMDRQAREAAAQAMLEEMKKKMGR
jgi:hypothetical protein